MARSKYTAFATVAAVLVSSACASLGGSYNGLAVTPQMGWDNWNAFGCDVSEELLLGTARKIVDYGYVSSLMGFRPDPWIDFMLTTFLCSACEI